MTVPRWIAAATVAGVGIALLVAGVLRWTPEVPADAAAASLAETVLSGPIAPDVSEGTDISEIPRSPSGQECLPRIEGSIGYMDVCWTAYRHPADSDPLKDYYVLSVYSTFGATAAGSPRWAVLRADLQDRPADNVFTSWPEGEFDASCEPMVVTIEFVDPGTQVALCNHIAAVDTSPLGRAITWTCRGCLIPDDRDRELSLYVAVGVPQGAVPTWAISADVGG